MTKKTKCPRLVEEVLAAELGKSRYFVDCSQKKDSNIYWMTVTPDLKSIELQTYHKTMFCSFSYSSRKTNINKGQTLSIANIYNSLKT